MYGSLQWTIQSTCGKLRHIAKSEYHAYDLRTILRGVRMANVSGTVDVKTDLEYPNTEFDLEGLDLLFLTKMN